MGAAAQHLLLPGRHERQQWVGGRGARAWRGRRDSGAQPGRILMSGSDGAYARDVVYFSDDGGASWAASATALPGMDESGPAELPDGTIYVTLRNAWAGHRQAYALSQDGGATFSAPQLDPALVSPQCQASVAVLAGRLFFCNSAEAGARGNLTVRRSAPGGAGSPPEWESALLLAEGLTWGGYSSVAGPLQGGRAGVLAERNDTLGGNVISYTTFPLFGW